MVSAVHQALILPLFSVSQHQHRCNRRSNIDTFLQLNKPSERTMEFSHTFIYLFGAAELGIAEVIYGHHWAVITHLLHENKHEIDICSLSTGYSNIKNVHTQTGHTQHPGYQMNRRLIKFLFASETMELQLNPFLIAVRKYNKLRRICMETNLYYVAPLITVDNLLCVYLREWVAGGGGF